MKEFEYKGLIVELEEFDQEENGGSGITWTSYVYKNKEMGYIDKGNYIPDYTYSDSI